MSAAKPLASLSSSLLARKGGARPAMRPQLALRDEDTTTARQDDLGWNDMGEAAMGETLAAITPQDPDNATLLAEKPVIVQQIEALAAAIAGESGVTVPQGLQPVRTKGGKPVRSALQEGRKAAFTLRLDSYRHLRLRLACTLQDRSAQAVVTEALDRFLADLPGLEELARRATHT